MLLRMVVEVMVKLLLLLLQLQMRLHRRRRLLNDHRRFADRLLLLLLVGFDFNRWCVGIGRNDRCSTSSSHFRYSRRNRRDHRMMRRWRKMWWWRIDGLQRTSTGIDHFVGLLPCRRSTHVEHLSLAGMNVCRWWRMIRRWMLQMGRCLMMYQHATR